MMVQGGWLDRARCGAEFGCIGIRGRAYFIGRGVLYTMPGDGRAVELVRRHGVIAPRATRLWRRMLKVKQPSLVLDIGSNYGEMIMACRFPGDSKVIAVEPNPAIADVLERSIRTHRDAGRIRVVRKLLSNVDGQEHSFYDDPAWSGTSHVSVAPSTQGRSRARLTLRATTVDALVDGHDLRHIAFKCDVEGFEGRVLAGMRQTLASAGSFIGLVELHPDQLDRSGDGLSPIDQLQAVGEAKLVDPMARLVPMDESLAHHAQIVVASHPALLYGLSGRLHAPRLLRRISH